MKQTLWLLVCLLVFSGAYSKKKLPHLTLSKDHKEWNLTYEDIGPDVPIAILESGYRMTKAYKVEEKKNWFGQKEPAMELTNWEWKTKVRNSTDQSYCVEIMYLLRDKHGRKQSMHYAGKHVGGHETIQIGGGSKMFYDKALRVAKGDYRVKASKNPFKNFFCTGRVWKKYE